MLTNLIQTYTSRLTLHLSRSIVIRYDKKRSIFDKTSYNPEWIPKVRPYSKHRKPGMKEWSDPELVLPNYIPPMHRRTNFREYVRNVVEKEEMTKAQRKKEFFMEDIRAGDIVDITYQETYESENTVTHRGFVLCYKRRKSLTASLELLIRLGGMNIKAIYLVNSPKVRNIELISRGSGNFRSNLKHNWKKMTKS